MKVKNIDRVMIWPLPIILFMILSIGVYWLTFDSRSVFTENLKMPVQNERILVEQGNAFKIKRYFCKYRDIDGMASHYLILRTDKYGDKYRYDESFIGNNSEDYISYINLYSRPMATTMLDSGCHEAEFTYVIPSFIDIGDYDFHTSITHRVNPLNTQVTDFRPIRIRVLKEE